jgi:hypothetical protein
MFLRILMLTIGRKERDPGRADARLVKEMDNDWMDA